MCLPTRDDFASVSGVVEDLDVAIVGRSSEEEMAIFDTVSPSSHQLSKPLGALSRPHFGRAAGDWGFYLQQCVVVSPSFDRFNWTVCALPELKHGQYYGDRVSHLQSCNLRVVSPIYR